MAMKPRAFSKNNYGLISPYLLERLRKQFRHEPLPPLPEADIIQLENYQTFWDFLRIQKNIYKMDISDIDKPGYHSE